MPLQQNFHRGPWVYSHQEKPCYGRWRSRKDSYGRKTVRAGNWDSGKMLWGQVCLNLNFLLVRKERIWKESLEKDWMMNVCFQQLVVEGFFTLLQWCSLQLQLTEWSECKWKENLEKDWLMNVCFQQLSLVVDLLSHRDILEEWEFDSSQGNHEKRTIFFNFQKTRYTIWFMHDWKKFTFQQYSNTKNSA